MPNEPTTTNEVVAAAPAPLDYSDYLKAEFGRTIDRLTLSELQKDFLRSRWLDQILWMEGRASESRNLYYRLRLTTILGGVLVPILISLNSGEGMPKEVSTALRYTTIGLGAIVAASSAVEEFFHCGERWRHYRRSAESLKAQGWQFFQLTGSYATYNKTGSHQDAFVLFSSQVEEIIQRDVETYSTQVAQEKQEKQEESSKKSED
jgi:Protein of unknown function (DUF4231)